MLILVHVKITAQPPPSSLSCIITLSIDPLTVQEYLAGGEGRWRSPPPGAGRRGGGIIEGEGGQKSGGRGAF